MYKLPTDLDCLLPCKPALERIMMEYDQRGECGDIASYNRTFYNCYFRERRVAAPSFLGAQKPRDFFYPRTDLDMAVMACYIYQFHYFDIKSVNLDGEDEGFYFGDCIKKGSGFYIFILTIECRMKQYYYYYYFHQVLFLR